MAYKPTPTTINKGRLETVVGDQQIHTLLMMILHELQTMNLHLAVVTGEHIIEEDLT